jgi:hypothetical protein
MMTSSIGELLVCQPYGGASTFIADYGQGQGPNVVLGLTEQYGLLPGSKAWISKIFYQLSLHNFHK